MANIKYSTKMGIKKNVDILIPFHGQYYRVKKLIESIARFTSSHHYNIFLIDDGSKNNDFLETMLKIPILKGIRSDTQKGMGAAINLGIQNTNNELILIINSDCEIHNMNWLTQLETSLINLLAQRVMLVSAKTNAPPGNFLPLKAEQPLDEVDQLATEALPLFCCLCHRQLFRKIGLLKEYPYGWYEDTELFYRMKKHDLYQGVCSKSWVKHYDGETIKELWREHPESREIMLANKELCVSDVNKLFT